MLTISESERAVAGEQFKEAKAREREPDPPYITVYVDSGETKALLEVATERGYALQEETHFMGGGILVLRRLPQRSASR